MTQHWHKIKHKMKKNGWGAIGPILISSLVLIVAACSIQKPNKVVPAPSEHNFPKTFFINPDGTAKVFMGGFAAEELNGGWTDIGRVPIAGYNEFNHSNLIFKIHERTLAGYLINPSYIDSPSRWEKFIEIPILSHFYLESEKDSRGRDTNVIVENHRRSDWRARPNIKLDLHGFRFVGERSSQFGLPEVLSDAREIERVEKEGENFLGFTVSSHNMAMSSLQQSLRINFKQIKLAKNFQRVPFHRQNAHYVNLIHVSGLRHNGVYEQLFTARWNLSKDKPTKLRLYGWPEEFLDIAEDSVADWNVALTKALAPEFKKPRKQDGHYIKYFETYVSNEGHAFDMRYPTLQWVSDVEQNHFGPLGLGQAGADVRNGEIQWGHVHIFGGYLNSYVRSWISAENLSGGAMIGSSDGKTGFGVPSEVFSLQGMESFMNRGLKSQYQSPLYLPKDLDLGVKESLQPLYLTPATVEHPQAFFSFLQGDFEQEKIKNYQNVSSYATSQQLPHYLGLYTKDISQDSVGERDGEFRRSKAHMGRRVFDADRQFADVLPSVVMAFKKNSNIDVEQAVRSLLKEILVHEIGHMLGLGHNFKAGIAPEIGAVPEKYLVGDPDSSYEYDHLGLQKRATKEHNWTNYHSVMGYPNGRTVIHWAPDDIKPGPYDIAAVRYSYRGEYPVYNNQEKWQDLQWKKVPKTGIIPASEPGSPDTKVAFFPMCNDFDSLYTFDPFCAKHSQGTTATDIVTNYIARLKETMVTDFINFTSYQAESENSYFSPEMYSWVRGFSTFSRLRLFYDFMRYKYRDILEPLGQNAQNLYDFHDACKGINQSNQELRKVFDDPANQQLVDLCQASALVIEELQKTLKSPLSDYAKKDFDKAYLGSAYVAGDAGADYTHLFGPVIERSGFGLKLAALFNLTSPEVYTLNPSTKGVMAIPQYSDATMRFAISTFYPVEYMKALTSAIVGNIKSPATGGTETTKIGRLVPMVGYFNGSMMRSNDTIKFPGDIIDRLFGQLSFDVNYGIALLEEHQKDNNSSIVTHFTSSIYDFRTRSYTATDDTYILENRDLLIKGRGNEFIMPMSKIRFFAESKDSKGQAYAYVVRVTYDHDRLDRLTSASPFSSLLDLHTTVLEECLEGSKGSKNGLRHYFNQGFEGFSYSSNIGGQPTRQDKFFESVDNAFETYYDSGVDGIHAKPQRSACNEAVKGIRAIVSSAAILNGQPLAELFKLMEVGQ